MAHDLPSPLGRLMHAEGKRISPASSLVVIKLMMVSIISLCAASFSAVLLQHFLLPTFERRNSGSAAEGMADGYGGVLSVGAGAPAPNPNASQGLQPPPPPPPRVSDADAQEAFLELVKKRASIQTPLDNSFWRPYIRQPGADVVGVPQPRRANGTQLIFVAGAEGTGHHFITALLMRLPQLMPMTLVQEQAFQSLWWKMPRERDPAVFFSALEAFSEWVRTARSLGKHPAFCARACLRPTGMKHCSWVSGLQLQNRGKLLDGRGHNGSFQPIGQMFSYPFSRSWNETEDGTHFPSLADLQYLCDLLGVRLKVIVLWRDPIDAIMSMNNRGLPKIWRRFGRTFKLHKQVALYLSQLDEMYTQIAALRADDYRIVNYTNLLLNPHDYESSLAEFLQLPPSSLGRSFTLSLKAKPKKRSNATAAPMDGGTTSMWSDEVRRNFIATRISEAKGSASPPRCCDEWTSEFAKSPVVKVKQPTPPRRKVHWFSEWASEAPPPLRAESISFTHVINPFKGGQDLEHKHAQMTTLKSIAHAAALANAVGVNVDVVCVMYPEDVPHVDICGTTPGFRVVTLNLSAHDTLPQFKHPVRLPFLNQILYAGWLHGKGRFLTYSNIDIGIQATFYTKLARQLQVMPDVPVSLVREEFEHTPAKFGVEQALGWRGNGLGHPGHDCWTFPRDWVPKLVMGFTMVGVSMVATDLMQALHAHSGCRMALLSPELTFHHVQGESVVKHPGNQRARNNQIFTGLYTAWNCVQFARNRRDVLQVHPEYSQCWFNHQAEWSSYAYQCGQTIEHLPHEFKLLWHSSNKAPDAPERPHNGTNMLEGPGRSNCNLPTICHHCRGGKDGDKRPAADLMSNIPCGFCRCASDLAQPSLVTLPPAPETEAATARSSETETPPTDAAPTEAAPVETAASEAGPTEQATHEDQAAPSDVQPTEAAEDTTPTEAAPAEVVSSETAANEAGPTEEAAHEDETPPSEVDAAEAAEETSNGDAATTTSTTSTSTE